MLTSKEIRKQFLDFFKEKGHTTIKSAPVVPQDDPTLMFNNAGMNQFKDVFLGQGTRAFNKAANTQKCIRVSGKHNDLDEVGRDGYHHTFFEMLGNWSFGDYYKKEAITWAWQLLTEVWKLDKDRLFITVYRTDDEAMELWKEVSGFDESRILRFDEKDNFWEMGEIGPCGPCSEIHYDRTPNKTGKDLVNADSEEVIEIWNLVFIQYNRKQDKSLEPLKDRHIDTGMGFERIVAVLQGQSNNYDTDIFIPIIEKISKLSGQSQTSVENRTPMQIIADHIRMTTIAIADGALPSNVGRGYVIRRVLRRAARFGRKLGLNEPFMYKLVDILTEQYEEVFPEIAAQKDFIMQVIKAEENSFKKNLDRGIKLFEELIKQIPDNGEIKGKDAFILYDTYGFPIDMTQQMAEERGISVNINEYNKELDAAKERSREHTSNITTDWVILNNSNDLKFSGYNNYNISTEISRYRKTGEQDSQGHDLYQIILLNTPFYGESGGQLGDSGIISNDNFMLQVNNSVKEAGQIISIGTLVSGDISNQKVNASIDVEKRLSIAKNHTATHLLHQALKDILGNHVQQKGSLVAKDYLRFDFSHFEGMTREQILMVEEAVNKQILKNTSLEIEQLKIDDAKAKGAQALFGEKYGDVVRTVGIGNYSMELCGGSHVLATGEIGSFKILSEGSISSGIRRIEAITGIKAFEFSVNNNKLIHQITSELRCQADEIMNRLDSLLEKNKLLQKDNNRLKQKDLINQADSMVETAENINGIKVITQIVEVTDIESLKNLAQSLRDKMQSSICVLGAELNSKAILVVSTSDDLVAKGIKSGTIVGELAKMVGGGGGGHPRLAQAGGKKPEKLAETISSAVDIIKQYI